MIGTIYKIEIDNNVYIGSTIQKLKRREHKHNIRLNVEDRNNKLYRVARENNLTCLNCIPLDTVEVEDLPSLRNLEQQTIETIDEDKLLNEYNAFGFNFEKRKKYIEKNREKRNSLLRENYSLNKHNFREKKKKYYYENIDRIREQNLKNYYKHHEANLQRCKDYYNKNKDIINEKKRMKRLQKNTPLHQLHPITKV